MFESLSTQNTSITFICVMFLLLAVSLPVVACKFRFVFRAAFSVLALVWHYLVTFVLIAVSRSFTISIRQLMQTLERDGRAYECHYMGVRHASDDDMLLQVGGVFSFIVTIVVWHALDNDVQLQASGVVATIGL